MSVKDKELKWKDIYFEATKLGASEEAIRIKDQAIHEAQELVESLGLRREELVSETLKYPELVVDNPRRKLNVRFDEKGKIVRVTTTEWMFEIMYGRRRMRRRRR